MAEIDSSSPPAPPEKPRKGAAAEPPPPKKTVVEWAEAKGFLPQELPRPARAAAATLKFGAATLMGVATRHNPTFWKYAAAKAANGWLDNSEVTEAEFDAEIDAHTNLQHA